MHPFLYQTLVYILCCDSSRVSQGFKMTQTRVHTGYSRICSVRLPRPIWPILYQWDPISHALEQLNAITAILLTSLTSFSSLPQHLTPRILFGVWETPRSHGSQTEASLLHISKVSEIEFKSLPRSQQCSLALTQNVVHARHLTVYPIFCQHHRYFWFMSCHKNDLWHSHKHIYIWTCYSLKCHISK